MSFRQSESRPPRLVHVPTRGGGVRMLTVLDPVDDARFRSLVQRVAATIERALGPAVLGNRAAPGPGLALRPWHPAWRRLVGARAGLRARGAVLLRADVRQCYSSISDGAVHRALVRLGTHRDDATAIARELDRFHGAGVLGLPIGPEASAVLANAVLRDADLALEEAGCPHVRWVDDVWAAADTRARAERTLDRLRSALVRIGLEVNEGKTRVIVGADTGALLGSGSDSSL